VRDYFGMTREFALPQLFSKKFAIIAAVKATNENQVVVIGSSNTDLVVSCARLPIPGETILGGDFERFAGGKGANQAVAAARAGAKVSFIGARGDDDFGRAAHAGLKADGIDVRHFRVKPEYSSGVALILIGGKNRENMIAVAKSANEALSPADVQAAEGVLARAGVVVAQLEIPLATVERAAQIAARHGVRFLLNPAPARKLSTRLLKLTGILTPNQSEAELLTGESDPSRAARVLLARGCGAVALTCGAKGVLLLDAQGDRFVRAPKVKALDTVGAGDCFCGYLAAGLAQQLSFDEAAKRAVTAASLSVTRRGAQAGMPVVNEVDARL
jgi:ribokinase